MSSRAHSCFWCINKFTVLSNHKEFRAFVLPTVLLVITTLFVGATRLANDPPGRNIVKWVVEKNSSLQVAGKSNVNNFTCNITGYAAKDTIICMDDPSGPIKLSGELQMDIQSFNCNSDMITNDLRKTLKAATYPSFNIRFLSLQSMPSLKHSTELIKGSLEVELAGVVKKFELYYSFTTIGAGYMKLEGSHTFCFSDFKLSPPRKLAGLIKIKNEFEVNFQLVLREI